MEQVNASINGEQKASILFSLASVSIENGPLSPLSVKGNEENEKGKTQAPFDCLTLGYEQWYVWVTLRLCACNNRHTRLFFS